VNSIIGPGYVCKSLLGLSLTLGGAAILDASHPKQAPSELVVSTRGVLSISCDCGKLK